MVNKSKINNPHYWNKISKSGAVSDIHGRVPISTRFLRDEDKTYVTEVAQYLTGNGLQVEFGGSVLKGDKKYNDIDLLAVGNPKEITNVFSGLCRYNSRIKPFQTHALDGAEFSIKDHKGFVSYLDTTVDHRFDVSVGNTKIDLNLKDVRTPQSRAHLALILRKY